jgi:hypothetical protein
MEEKDPSYNFLKLYLTKEHGRRGMARTVGRILSLIIKNIAFPCLSFMKYSLSKSEGSFSSIPNRKNRMHTLKPHAGGTCPDEYRKGEKMKVL